MLARRALSSNPVAHARRAVASAPKNGSASMFEHSAFTTGRKMEVLVLMGVLQVRSMVPLALNGPARNRTFGFGRLTEQSTTSSPNGPASARVVNTQRHQATDHWA